MVRTVILVASVAGWAASAGFVAVASSEKLGVADKSFIQAAAAANVLQLNLARLAQQLAPSDSERAEAGRAYQRQVEFATALKQAVATRDPAFKYPESLARRERLLLAGLRTSGRSFAATYREQMTLAQLELRTAIQKYLANPRSASALRTIAAKAMPTQKSLDQMTASLAQR